MAKVAKVAKVAKSGLLMLFTLELVMTRLTLAKVPMKSTVTLAMTSLMLGIVEISFIGGLGDDTIDGGEGWRRR